MSATLPHLSVTITGMAPSGGTPIGMAFTDTPSPGSFKLFNLVEKAAFRALCAAIIDEIDHGGEYEQWRNLATAYHEADDAGVSR